MEIIAMLPWDSKFSSLPFSPSWRDSRAQRRDLLVLNNKDQLVYLILVIFKASQDAFAKNLGPDMKMKILDVHVSDTGYWAQDLTG